MLNTKTQHQELAETSPETIDRIFKAQKANQFHVANTSVRERLSKLKKLHKVLLTNRSQLKQTLFEDLGKHPSEVDLIEIYTVTSELKNAKRNLRSWLNRHPVSTPLAFSGSSSFIRYEAKGVVLIISPWNFPVNLTFGPLVTALAAGNTVILKPSESTPHTSRLMKEMINSIFPENEVAVIEGGKLTSTQLLALPFNHIFFTGSIAVGKIVMSAAAKHLTSVTLELGGKSPVIIDETANISQAAKRTVWGKFANNGQICISPDHIYVHESRRDDFVKKIKEYILEFYGQDAKQAPSYSRIVNSHHFNRLTHLIDEAIAEGANLEMGGGRDAEINYIEPTILSNVSPSAKVMDEEIFGPILPILTYSNIDTLIEELNQKEKPLALYIFSQREKNIQNILTKTRAGTSGINHVGIQFYNHHLPFGGSNQSGIGKAHGWHGFLAFSNARGVYQQHVPGALELLAPPYNKFKQWLIDFTIKWL